MSLITQEESVNSAENVGIIISTLTSKNKIGRIRNNGFFI